MTVHVARLYRFRGVHHLPQLADTEWGERHQHAYTVEVVALSGVPLGLDSALLDQAWELIRPHEQGRPVDMDVIYGAENTTVEALAEAWLLEFREYVDAVERVTVWEDSDRWAVAQ